MISRTCRTPSNGADPSRARYSCARDSAKIIFQDTQTLLAVVVLHWLGWIAERPGTVGGDVN
jgi:hypothetical protein